MQRLGKNTDGYRGDRIDIRAVLGDIRSAALRTGWTAEVFFKNSLFEWLGLHRPARAQQETAPRLYISSGIHGDEPAGPLAVRQLLEEDRWPATVELWLCPCLNPTGFLLNSRENQDGIDLNRQYLRPTSAETVAHMEWLARQPSFDLCLCLHEDWESHGFYIYELNPDNRPSVAQAVIQKVEEVCPIDRSDVIEGRPAAGGIILPSTDPRSRPDWPEAFYLLTHKTRFSCTLEAPSDFPLPVRVASLVAGVKAAVEKVAQLPKTVQG
jgi:hypothetical protein